MSVWHDLECQRCGFRETDVLVSQGRIRRCPCGGARKIVYDGWQTVHTDLFTTPQYSDAAGLTFSSQREKERHMAGLGYQVAGDRVGGARADHTLKHKAVSYAGQGCRKSTAERVSSK
jgi:hypothetical protein